MPTNYDRAQVALRELKDVVLSEITATAGGLTNAEIVKRLGLASDYEGKNHNYLSWSILGLLLGEGRIRYEGEGQRERYFACRER